jgi:hypothetical protein
MLMAQAIRPPASPVGSVLSDTHSMSPGNGASSSILPGSEEGIGGRHGFPTRSRSPLSTTSGRNTADLDAGRYRFAPRRRAGDGAAKDGGAFASAPTAITLARHIEPVGAQEGKPIPLGWAFDREGHPTADPKAGLEGPMLPARAKGATRRSPAPEPAFGHAAGRKCPLAKGTAAAILPTGRAGRTESF